MKKIQLLYNKSCLCVNYTNKSSKNQEYLLILERIIPSGTGM